MRIYLAAPIRGVRTDPAVYEAMAEAIRKSGHDLLSEHPVGRAADFGERGMSEGQIFYRDVEWMNQSDLLVAEVSTPSIGVGWEIAYTLARGKLAICVCHESARGSLSAMVAGNPNMNQRILYYATPEDLQEKLVKALRL